MKTNTTNRVTILADKMEAEIIRVALAAHREKLAHALPKAKRAKDSEHAAKLAAESRATSQMITVLDRALFEAAQRA